MMNNKILKNCILLALMLFNINTILAQLHDAHWILGEHTSFGDTTYTGVMDFNMTAEPVLDNSIFKVVTFFRSNGSFSDAEGNLLVFSNGSKFFDVNGNVVPGGEDLHPGDNSEYGYSRPGEPIFLDNPDGSASFYAIGGDVVNFIDINNINSIGDDSIFYFKLDYGINSQGVRELSNIEERNTIVQDTFSNERLRSVRHANGRDWWLLMNYHRSNRYLKVILEPEGFTEHDIQEVGEPTILGIDQSVISPDGRFYGVYSLSGLVQGPSESSVTWYEFDRCSGEMSNYNRHILTSTNEGGSRGGIAFSPNSRFMYVAMTESIYQFDMEAEDIIGSKTLVATYDGHIDSSLDSTSMIATRFNLMQLAPNGKIYITVPSTRSRHLHVIDQPDSLGLACNVIQRAVELPYYHWFNMPNFPNYRLKSLIGSPCDTLRPLAAFAHDSLPLTTFTDQSDRSPTEWLWTFGDGNTSNEQNPIHQYTENGTYEVCLIASNQSGSDTTCQTINIIVTSVEDLSTASFSIYPNPTDGVVTVVLPDDFGGRFNSTEFRLQNVLGQAVRQGLLSNQKTELDFSKMESGMYWLTVEGMGVRKLVVE